MLNSFENTIEHVRKYIRMLQPGSDLGEPINEVNHTEIQSIQMQISSAPRHGCMVPTLSLELLREQIICLNHSIRPCSALTLHFYQSLLNLV